MGVDYVVNHDCEPKREHDVDGLLGMMKSRAGIDVIVDQMRRSGNNQPLEEIKITRVLRRPEGDVETKVTIAELRASSAPLDAAKVACANCPADRNRGGFGCFGYITYPIPEAAEQWLLSKLPADLDSPAMYIFKAAVKDFDYSGAPSRRMRDAGDMFFEARKAPTREWGKRRLLRGSELAVTADQLFHLMFHVGKIKAEHAAMVCVFFGLIPVEAFSDKQALARVTVQLPDHQGGAQLGQFLQTLAYAAANDLTVSVSA